MKGDRLVLTVGINPWCSSNWQAIYYRIFRIGPGANEAALLLDGAHSAWVGGDWHAKLEGDTALIEFPDLYRNHVLHYKVEANRVRRIDPIALQPQDFVDEWLTRAWSEIAPWTAGGASLEAWHRKLHTDFVSGEFEFVQRCVNPNLWQIALEMKAGKYYFLVRQTGLHRYEMKDVSATRQPGCPGESHPHGESPSLFPRTH